MSAGASRIARRWPNGEPDWLKQATRYQRFMHYTPAPVFILLGGIPGSLIGLGMTYIYKVVFQ